MNDDYSPHASRVTRKKGSIYPPVGSICDRTAPGRVDHRPLGVKKAAPGGSDQHGRGRRFGFGRVVFLGV